jgi:hypothetical protein
MGRARLRGTPLRAVGPVPPPPPPPRTKWTRRVPHPVLIGHAASLTYARSAPPRPTRAPARAPLRAPTPLRACSSGERAWGAVAWTARGGERTGSEDSVSTLSGSEARSRSPTPAPAPAPKARKGRRWIFCYLQLSGTILHDLARSCPTSERGGAERGCRCTRTSRSGRRNPSGTTRFSPPRYHMKPTRSVRLSPRSSPPAPRPRPARAPPAPRPRPGSVKAVPRAGADASGAGWRSAARGARRAGSCVQTRCCRRRRRAGRPWPHSPRGAAVPGQARAAALARAGARRRCGRRAVAAGGRLGRRRNGACLPRV